VRRARHPDWRDQNAVDKAVHPAAVSLPVSYPVAMNDDGNHDPGPPRQLSDFMSPFAEFNAETRRLRRKLAREEEELAARALR
jgi:hypothetical protein